LNTNAEPSKWYLADGCSLGFSLLPVNVYDFKMQTTFPSFDKITTCVKIKVNTQKAVI